MKYSTIIIHLFNKTVNDIKPLITKTKDYTIKRTEALSKAYTTYKFETSIYKEDNTKELTK